MRLDQIVVGSRHTLLYYTPSNRIRLGCRHVSDIQMQQASDQAILDYAREQKRVCVTLDADFHGLLAVNNMKSPSVIRVRQEGLKGTDMAQLLRGIWPVIETKITGGAMVTVTEKNIRVRYLPIVSGKHDHEQ